MNTKQPTVYIITNKYNGTLYVGVTSNLNQRIFQHKNGLIDGFSKRYGCKNLVFYEHFQTMTEAIIQEKQIKSKIRKYKIDLIESTNPLWKDLANDW